MHTSSLSGQGGGKGGSECGATGDLAVGCTGMNGFGYSAAARAIGGFVGDDDQHSQPVRLTAAGRPCDGGSRGTQHHHPCEPVASAWTFDMRQQLHHQQQQQQEDEEEEEEVEER